MQRRNFVTVHKFNFILWAGPTSLATRIHAHTNTHTHSHTLIRARTHSSHTRRTFAADVILFSLCYFSAHCSTLCPLPVAPSLAPCPVPGNWVPGNCLGELSMNYVVLLRGPEFENLLKYARHCSGTTTGTGCGSCTGSGTGSATCRSGGQRSAAATANTFVPLQTCVLLSLIESWRAKALPIMQYGPHCEVFQVFDRRAFSCSSSCSASFSHYSSSLAFSLGSRQ